MTTLPATLKELFDYSVWARERLFETASGCSDEHLDTPFDMGEGSLRKTLHHLWGTEETWLQRWETGQDSVDDDEVLPVADIAARFEATTARWQMRLSALSQDDLESPFEYVRPGWMPPGPPLHLPRDLSLLHVINHGVHHRAQAINMLKRLGYTPPVLDYIRRPGHATQFDSLTLVRYSHYGDWAFQKVHAAAAALDDDKRNHVYPIGPGTVHRVARHLVDAPMTWFDRLEKGVGLASSPTPPNDSWPHLWTRYLAMAARRAALTDLEREVVTVDKAGQERRFPLGVILLQLCVHSTHHRAQALNMLRHAGVTVEPTDVAPWYRAGLPRVSVGGTSQGRDA